jgi:hypothetical protein
MVSVGAISMSRCIDDMNQGSVSKLMEIVPSKMRTAVPKSLTLRAALRAAAITEGEGTRS